MTKMSSRVALYEVVNKERFKSAQEKALSSVSVAYKKDEQPKSVDQIPPAEKIEKPAVQDTVWTAKPKIIRLYPDRIEFCLSWQVAGIGILTLIALFLVFFRLGQIYSIKKSEPKKTLSTTNVPVERIMPQIKAEPTITATEENQAKPKMVEPMGDHIIVIASHPISSHLEPVKQYFAGFGIATEIIKKDSRWLLITQERFNNPDKPGTDGFEMKKKIMSIGANYKPPAGSGFEPFGLKPFQDAYGMKVN